MMSAVHDVFLKLLLQLRMASRFVSQHERCRSKTNRVWTHSLSLVISWNTCHSSQFWYSNAFSHIQTFQLIYYHLITYCGISDHQGKKNVLFDLIEQPLFTSYFEKNTHSARIEQLRGFCNTIQINISFIDSRVPFFLL